MFAAAVTGSAIIVSYNRGPLTTVLTPLSSCLLTLTFVDVMYFGHDRTRYYNAACYPSSHTSTYTLLADNGNWNQYYYSLGQCSEAWAHTTTFTSCFTNAGDDGGQVLFSLGPDTTAVLCCPSGYAYFGVVGHQCGMTIQSSGAKLLYATTSLLNNAIVLANPAMTTITSAYTIWGDGIPIWWQSSDLAAFTALSQTTTSLPPTSSYMTSSTTATSTSTSSPAPNSMSSSLSSGAKTAIGITIGVVLVAVLLGIFFYFRRHGKSRGRKDTFGGEGVGYPSDRGELVTDGAITELESRPVQYGLPNYQR